MALSPATKELLYEQLNQVFITRGYDGATLAHLSAATGLSKASLYHHFPGGKPEMIATLIRQATSRLQQLAFAQLETQESAINRLHNFVDGFAAYTRENDDHCLLAVVAVHNSAANELETHHQQIAQQSAAWLENLAAAYETTGMKPKKSRRAAQELMQTLYGALLSARMQQQPKLFKSAIKRCKVAISSLEAAAGR